MLSNIYDRLYFILEKVKGVEARIDILERYSGKSRGKRLNTFYGEQTGKLKNLFKKIKNVRNKEIRVQTP